MIIDNVDIITKPFDQALRDAYLQLWRKLTGGSRPFWSADSNP